MDNPEQYSENNQHQKIRVEEFFKINGEKLISKFNGEEISLIDIGSGCGRILNDVIIGKSGLKFSKIVGVDVSEKMVKFSNKKYANNLISFHVMDAGNEIPENLKNLKFDLVTSFFCLHWINDLNKAFENIQKFLKPNGIFCCMFTQLRKPVIQKLDKANEDVKKALNYDNLSSFRLPGDPTAVIRKHLNNNGMKILKIVDNDDDEAVFEGVGDLKGNFETYMPNLESIPESQRMDILQKIFELFDLKLADGKFVTNFRVITFVAQKTETMQSHL